LTVHSIVNERIKGERTGKELKKEADIGEEGRDKKVLLCTSK